MPLGALFKSFYSHELADIGLHSKHGTVFRGSTVNQNGTRAARGGIAPNVRTRQAQRIANPMHEQRSRLDIPFIGGAVDVDRDVMGAHIIHLLLLWITMYSTRAQSRKPPSPV